MDGERDSSVTDVADTGITDLSLEEADDTIVNCLERIERNGGVRGGKPSVARALTALDPIIQYFGLSLDELSHMLDIILKGKLDDSTTRKMIKLLLPRLHVPEMCAVKVLGCLGRHISFTNQAHLLKWVIVVYDLLDSRTKIHQLYGVVFHYLSYETLRPFLCHLLYYLTRREDVKPFRIRKLLDLQITVGKEPALAGLLHIFKSYYPDLILTPMPLSNSTVFKCPDQVASERIMTLQDRWSHLAVHQEHGLSLDGSKEPITKVTKGTKRQKLVHSSIPDAFSIYRSDSKLFPLAQITSLDSLVQHIDTLALPDQLASVLSNRLLQHVLCLQTSHAVVERISYWLGQELMDLWYWREKTDVIRARFATILSKAVEVTTMIKDLLPVVEHFMIPYLKVWNGVDNQKEIFTLITYLRPREYEELFVLFLKPLYDLFNLMGPIWKGELLLCYTKLLQRWTQFKWKDYLELGKDPRLSRDGLEGLRRLFSKLAPNVDYMMTIRTFITHVNSISSVALEIEHDNLAVQHGVLSFFDFVPYLTLQFKVPLALIIPDSTIVYRCFLSDSGMAVSRICGVVYHYKQAFEVFEQDQEMLYEMLVQSQLSSQIEEGDEGAALRALPILPDIPGYSRDYVILFNGFVMDFCNFLWRSRAFNKSDKNARGFLMNQGTIARTKQICLEGGLSINNMLSLSHSVPLSGYSARFLKNLEDQSSVPMEKRLRAPVSPPALKDMSAKGGLDIPFEEYRLQYLDHLEQNGFEGIVVFLFDSITNLLQRKLQRLEREREQEEKERQLSQSMEQASIERKDEAPSSISPLDVEKP